MKGFKTAGLAILQVIIGALVGAGLLTPDLGEQVTTDVIASIEAFETLIGSAWAAFGVVGVGVRHVTDSVAGWRK